MTPDQPFAAWQQWMGSSPFPGVPGMEASLREGWSKALEQLQNFDATELGVTGAAMRQAPQIRFAPEKLQQLQQDYLREATELWNQSLQSSLSLADKRFKDDAWERNPMSAFAAAVYLLNARTLLTLAEAAESDPKTKARLVFAVEQWMAASAPSNFLAFNPEAIKKAVATKGESLARGVQNMLTDMRQGHVSMTDESLFEVGKNVATTEGAVVFENDFFQLIEYKPLTAKVHERPFLLVPPCINKFYILDLKPENSFVAHAVAQGFDIYLVSWRNVPEELKALTWEDYLDEGVLTAIDETRADAEVETINVLGFCVGGTILASALGVLAARGELEDFVESATYLTTLLDFSEPGDIKAYLGESTYQMRVRQFGPDGTGGMMKGAELAQSFATLRANDLIWNYVVNNYLKGQDPPAFDLLYWNGDSTNLPGPMYLYYIRNFYLDNKLTEHGGIEMLGEKVDLADVTIPSFVYCSREDHIVPWKSAYASAQLWGGKVEFVMGASGHIAGVINPPGAKKRSYWTGRFPAATPEAWDAGTKEHAGSWWPHWYSWLAQHSGKRVAAPKVAKSKLGAAPGRYVLDKA